MSNERKPVSSELYERAIFGAWDDNGTKRHKGLLEQATDNEKRFADLHREVVNIKRQLFRSNHFMIFLAFLSALPALNSFGFDTKNLLPFILRQFFNFFH